MEVSLKERFAKGIKNVFDESFYEAIEGKRFVFFIGAGISRIMGVPGWDELATILINNAFPDYISSHSILKSITNSKQLISIAYNEFEKENRLTEFYNFFSNALKPRGNIKENVYKILAEFDAAYLTTNADNLFEEVLGKELCHVGADYPLNNENHMKKNHLYYLHGHYTECVNHINDHLVFTAEQYVKRYNDGDFQEFLRTIFHKDNVIVFLGYGLNEYEIIDYIVTKSGDKFRKNKVYILEPFCDNEDILYNSKKLYFESLGISLIPYDISTQGYCQIIDVLKELLNTTKKNVIVPVLDDIKKYCERFNDENLNEIVGYLKRNNDLSQEQIIVKEILNSKDYRWVKSFWQKDLFSEEKIEEKINCKSWPLIELLLDWIKSGEKAAQEKAAQFLDLLKNEHIEKLSTTNNSIGNYIMFIVMYLDKNHINSKYLSMAKKIMSLGKLYYFEDEEDNCFNNVISWGKSNLIQFLEVVFSFADYEQYHDNNSYSIKRILKKLNKAVLQTKNCKNVSKHLTNYFINLTISRSKKESFSLFKRLYDIDNVNKNYNEYWKIIINELLFSFGKINEEIKKKYVSNLLISKSDVENKLGFYLARKFNLTIEINYDNLDYFNNSILYHEFYLFLKCQIDNKSLNDAQTKIIYNSILKANWGFDLNYYSEQEHLDKMIIARKIQMLSLFNKKEFKEKVIEYTSNGYKAFNSIEIAKDVDWVRVSDWESSFPFPIEKIGSSSLKDLGQIYVDNIPKDKEFEIIDYAEKFAEHILSKDEKDFKTILESFEVIPLEYLAPIISQINSKFEKVTANKELVTFCIRILNDLYSEKNTLNSNKKNMLRSIFNIFNKTKYKSSDEIASLLEILYKWLSVFINTEDSFPEEERILDSLVNRGDFDKYSLILNLHIELKEKYGIELSEKQKLEIFKTLVIESDKTLLFTLCLNFQNMKYISNNNIKEIFDFIFSEKKFEITSLLLCICNSNYLFDELIELVKEKYLFSESTLMKGLKHHILSDQFYGFIMSAYNHNKITQEEYLNAFKDINYIKTLITYLPHRLKEDNYDFNKFVVLSWEQIKLKCNEKQQEEFANSILFTIDDLPQPTEEALDLYLDVVSYCVGDKSFYNLKALIPYFEINFEKADNLLNAIIDEYSYISVKDLSEVILVYSLNREKMRCGKRFLKKLKEKGVISIEAMENLAQKLDEIVHTK